MKFITPIIISGLVVVAAATNITYPTLPPTQQDLNPAEKAALDVFLTFLDGIQQNNASLEWESVYPQGFGVLSRPPTTYFYNLSQVIERIPTNGSLGPLYEQVYDCEVKVYYDIAMCWCPYQFWINGTIDHVGTNIVTLLNVNNTWLMTGVADTSRPPSSQ